MPSATGLPSVKQALKGMPLRESGLQMKNRGGSQVRLQPALDKITSAKLTGASPAIIDPILLEQSTQRDTIDQITARQKKMLFANIDDVQQQQSDPILDDDDETSNELRTKTHGIDKNNGFLGFRSSSNNVKSLSTNHLVASKSMQLLKPIQNQLQLKIPKQSADTLGNSNIDGKQWQFSVNDQLQRFKQSQKSFQAPKREAWANANEDQAQQSSTFSLRQNPQFRPLNCDPYTRERVSQFGYAERKDSLDQLVRKPTSKLTISLTGEQVVQGFGPSSHLHKMTVPKASQTGAIVGSNSTPYIQSELQQQARKQTKQLRLRLLEQGTNEAAFQRKPDLTMISEDKSKQTQKTDDRSKFTQKIREKAKESRNSTAVEGIYPPIGGHNLFQDKAKSTKITSGEAQSTEDILRQHYFIAKVTGKTTFCTLQKGQSPQKHLIRNLREDLSEIDSTCLQLNKREQQNEEFAVTNQRVQQIEKLQQQAASYMRLNMVWGLEPNNTSVDIHRAQVDQEAAVEGGVITNCIENDRQLKIDDSEDSDLDRMISLFQSQPEDDHYFIYCKPCNEKDPYDLVPLINYTKQKYSAIDPFVKFGANSQVSRPDANEKFYTLSKKGFTLYINDLPVEHTPLEEWLLERRFYKQIRSKDFFKNFKTWSIIRMWRRHVLQKHREQIKTILKTKLFSIDDVFGPILQRHRKNCKEMELNRIIDIKSQVFEVSSKEDFELKQKIRRDEVTKQIKEKSRICRIDFQDGINKTLDLLRKRINEQTEEEEKKNDFNKANENDLQQKQPKQIINTNPTLDALGFNHSLKYGNRSKLRQDCSRFLRFSYLLDFIATEALTNIYLLSIQDTKNKLEQLSQIPVKFDLQEGRRDLTAIPNGTAIDVGIRKRVERSSSINEIPFFRVQAVFNPEFVKTKNDTQGKNQKSQTNENSEKTQIIIPRSEKYTDYINEYQPEPAGNSKILDFNPTVHLTLEPEIQQTEESEIKPFLGSEEDEASRKIPVIRIRNIEKILLQIQPSGESFASIINDSLLEGMECLNNYERWSRHPDLNKYERVLESWDNRVCSEWEQPDKLYLDCDEWLVENELHQNHSRQITALMQSAFDKINLFFESYRPYLHAFWENEQIDFQLLQNDRLRSPVETIQALIQRFLSQKQDFEEILPESRDIGMIRIDCSQIKTLLKPSPKENLKQLKDLLPRVVKERIEDQKKWLKKQISEIKVKPEGVEQYVKQINQLDFIDANYQSHKDYIELNSNIYNNLIAFDIVDARDKAKRFMDEAYSLIRQLDSEIAQARENADKRKHEIKMKILAKIDPLNKETAEFMLEIDALKYLDIASDMSLMIANVENNDSLVNRLFGKKEKIQNYQKTLDMGEIEMFENVDTARSKHRFRKMLWQAIHAWTNLVRKWENEKFKEIDVEEISKQAEQYLRIVIQCERNLPAESTALKYLKQLVFDFKETMPIVQALGNQNLKEVHWIEIKSLLNMTEFPLQDKEFTLGELMGFKVASKQEEVENISVTATQEFKLNNQINQINDTWAKTDFEVEKYKDKDFVLSGIDKIVLILDESLSEVSDIQGSRYVKRLQAKVQKLQEELIMVSDTIEQWRECQRNWLYLENIFSSKEIKQQRQKDYQEFESVNRNWNKLMKKVSGKKNVLKNCSLKQYQEFLKNNEQMDRIQKNLEVYLEEKRTEFPRFFFISNDELLQLLAEQKVVSSVEKHLNKLFDNINRLYFTESKNDDDSDVHGIVSAEGERVGLNRHVKQHNTGVEIWLGNLRKEMKNTINKLVKEASKELNKSQINKLEWVLKHCGQAVTVVLKIKWTEMVEEAIIETEDDAMAISNLAKTLNENLVQLVDLIRAPAITDVKRKILVSLITQEVHGRSIVEQLSEQQIESQNDFEWQQCLRYYEQEGQKSCVVVRQVNTQIKYGCEYMGATSRLVITPLTDRCWLTITGALHIKLGASPQGPAGTGKTESTKDLAKGLGIFCFVFNCSEQVEYKIMGRLFSGLVQSGAWSCLDEFNRIDVEVLSVIAQQLLDIRQGKLALKDVFLFNEKEMPLKQNCGVFVTMNPGYAGRAELPDNLKVLFRPVAMMIPSYGLVAQVMLFAEGYNDAQKLSTKMVQLYKLSDEQLSQQDHYDFGMRAVKSVLVIAGNLKRKNPNFSEDVLLIKAMRDANVPKFLADDLPLFNAIVQDLFPNVVIPEEDQSQLGHQIDASLEQLNLMLVPEFKKKCLQLYETFNVRFGVMLVGPTGGGKSTCFSVLQHAITSLSNYENSKFQEVKVKILNPKSISMGELYGEENQDTKEWTDGLASKIIRKFVEDKQNRSTWTVFDGPVDALWIENMNTVLDDNMTLCLANGERIKLQHSMRILFEVTDLKVASPATVSRCGMVYMTSSDLGWKPYVHQWMNFFIRKNDPRDKPAIAVPEILTDEARTELQNLLDQYVNEAFNKLKNFQDQQQFKCEPVQIVKNLCNFLEYFLSKPNAVPLKEKKETWIRYINAFFGYSFIWAFAGHYRASATRFIDNMMRDFFSKLLIPMNDTVFDYRLDEKSATFHHWKETVPKFEYPETPTPFFQLVVSTVDTMRTNDILFKLTTVGKPVFITGSTGTGKSLIVQQFINEKKESLDLTPIILNFSAQTTSVSTQINIESKLIKKRQKVFGAKGNSKTLIFIDDVNMPGVEQFGAQPPIELMRQLIDHGGMYDRPNFFWKKIEKFSVVCAAAPPSGGRSELTPRFMRHFMILNVPDAQEETLKSIFESILGGFLQQEMFGENIRKNCCSVAVFATIDLYTQITKHLLPIPAKFHYTFNLRDIAKVFQGLLMTKPISIQDNDMFARLWLHEASRVFADRLCTPQDIFFFQDLAVEILNQKFKVKWAKKEIVFAQGADPLFSVILKVDTDQLLYEMIDKKSKLLSVLEDKLVDYNFSSSNKMDLVFFDDAIRHIIAILRILMQPRGNSMLIGVSGSGKQTLTKLAASILSHKYFQIKLSKNFKPSDFRDTLKEIMLPSGNEAIETTFILNDTQIMHESFLEDVNNILNTGEITNLFTKEDIDNMTEHLTKVLTKKKIPVTKDNIYYEFIEQLRDHFHIILCMSPVGDLLRNRCRKFPSLVNCCTLDWYFSWPEEALQGVAEQYLKNINTEQVSIKQKKALIELFPKVHKSVEESAEKLSVELRRKTYVTPKSYLDGIQLYIKHLTIVRSEHNIMKQRYENGVTKLKKTNSQIEELQVKLTELMPRLEVQNKNATIQADEIKQNKEVAQHKELEAESDAAVVRMDAQQIEMLKREAENELHNAAPALEAANKAVDTLDKNDVADLKQTKNPTAQTEIALKCILTYLGYAKPDWATAQKAMADIGFLNRIKNYDKQNIDPKIMEKVKKIVTDKQTFNIEKITLSNRAAGGLAKWCVALYRYAETLKIVQPIEANVKRMSEKYQAAMREVEKKQREVQSIKEKLRQMEDQLNETLTYIENLQSEKEKCEQRLINAGKLILLLGEEGQRWEENTLKLNQIEVFFAGNVFLAAASLSYLGPFNGQFRENLTESWKRFAKEFELQFSSDYSFRETLGDPVQIRNWGLAGLPSDPVSVDNAILAAKSSRWPLMIDPESQANKWIKKMFKTSEAQLSAQEFAQSNFGGLEFIVIRSGADSESSGLSKPKNSSQKLLEIAIIKGQTVLLEDVGADLDPGLDSILQKAIYKEDGINKINFGDKPIIYDEGFRFMMTTKLPNPHFLPETCIKTTIINFSVTFQGLEDQLLVDVINNLQPDLEMKRDKLVVEIAQKKNDLIRLQSLILKELAESNSDTILDNEFLIETLEIAKTKSVNTQSDLVDAEQVELQIDQTRNEHRGVAERGSILYFAIFDMSGINEMYQNSLQYVKKLFNEAIVNTPAFGDPSYINASLKDAITRQLYQKICIGLFEAHKIVYAFLICTGIKRREGKILERYWNLLLRGPGIQNKQNQPEKPANVSHFISDAQWDQIYCLQRISIDNIKKKVVQAANNKLKISQQNLKLDQLNSQNIQKSQKGGNQSLQFQSLNRSKDQSSTPSNSNKFETKNFKIPKPDLERTQMSKRSNETDRSVVSARSGVSAASKQSGRGTMQHSSGPFITLCKEIEQSAEDWEAYAIGFEPFSSYFYSMPCNFGERLSSFEKLLLIKIFKPEKIAESLTMYLESDLGPDYAVSPVSSIENLFAASDNTTPIIFVLSQGVDPTWQIIQYAEKQDGGKDKLKTMSLGQGQEKHAAKLIDDGIRDGNWVMLQNCHLFKSWMPHLAQKVNQLQEMKDSKDEEQQIHVDFRLILTSMPEEYFPTSVLQSGLKMTTEPPRGIKNNLQRSYMNIVTQDTYDELSAHFDRESRNFYSNQDTEMQSRRFGESKIQAADTLTQKSSHLDRFTIPVSIPDSDTLKNKNSEWRNLLFGLTFFHAVIQERRKFGPLGWNIFYEFSDADLRTSITMIKNFLLENDEIPWDAMKFMTGQINYGGRVTDDFDRQLLMTILQIFQNDDLVAQENYHFSRTEHYYCPVHENVDQLKEYINSLPNIDDPEIFGMHQNANIAYLKNESLKILTHVLNVQPRVTATKDSIGSDTQVLEMAKTLVIQVPEIIDVLTYHKDIMKTNAQGLLHCFSTVLMQEVSRYNLLLSQISQTLEELEQAVKGIILMSPALDLMYSALLKNQVPQLWQKVSYPSLKPLGSWIEDLKQRVQFMRVWAQKGHPKAFWLSGFFFQHGFITGILQTFARKHHKPIDLLQFSFNVLDEYDPEIIAKPPNEGVYVYGLFIENAKWSTHHKCLVEALIGEMNCKMPIIHFLPKYQMNLSRESKRRSILEEEEQEFYKCPVYKTNERAGVLSTTGKSTNFILTIDLNCSSQEIQVDNKSKSEKNNSTGVFRTIETSTDNLHLIQNDTPEFWMLRGVAIITMLNE